MSTVRGEGQSARCVRAMRRARAFEALCRKEGITRRPLVLKNVNAKISPQMMKWRRISSITLRLEPFMDDLERREGLARLVSWLEQKFTAKRGDAMTPSTKKKGGYGDGRIYRGDAEARRTETGKGKGIDGCVRRSHDAIGAVDFEGAGSLGASREGRQDACGTAGGTPAVLVETDNDGMNDDMTTGETPDLRVGGATVLGAPSTKAQDRMMHADWNSNVLSWERVKRDGFSIEAICANLGISRWKLTQLTKEFCNLTANELIDGFKLKQLKTFLVERLRKGAQALWGPPGYYAAFKAEGFLNCEGEATGEAPLLREKTKQSRFFRKTPRELFNEDTHAERERRTGELVERMWRGFDVESWAIATGFSSAARLKRAVLHVLGRSLRELERLLAAEVVDYYLCAEDRELRNLALKDETYPAIFRARELYHGQDEKPTEPFLDRWSAALFGAKEWLEKMGCEFG